MCTLDEAILHAYIDNDLEAHETLLLNEHLHQCSACRRTLNQLKVLDWDLRHLEVTVPQELAQLRRGLVAAEVATQEPTGLDLRSYYRLQFDVWQRSLSFMQLHPATKLVKKTTKSSRKRSSEGVGQRWSRRTGAKLRKRVTQVVLGKLREM